MNNNSTAFQDAVARAKEIAQKLTASAPALSANSSLKRPNGDDEFSNKRPSFTSPNQTGDIPSPVLRAQLVAQQINSQLGVKSTPGDPSSLPLSNQLTFQEDYKIPGRYVGLIIGKGGEQIIRLQAETGCKIQISQTRPDPVPGGDNGPPDRVANMSGTREALDRARRAMDDIVARGKAADGLGGSVNPYSMGGANAKTIEVMLPSAKCGLVIGKGGENIKRVSEEFGIKMFVGQEISDIDGIEHKPLRLTGEADKVERARQYVLDSLTKSGGLPLPSRFGGGSSSNNDYGSRTGGAPMSGPCNEAICHAPHDKAGVIIGKGGESIKEINRKSGAFVELDKAYIPAIGNSSDRIFKLRGTPEQIATAQQLMYDKVANSPGGAGDMLTPILFQQQFNLPLLGSGSTDPWAGSTDPYGTDANAATDPYTQWANAYGQWPAMNPYDNGTSTNSSSATDTSGMDPAWLAYYQSMSYYSMMQAGMTGATSSGTETSTTTTATDSTAAGSTNSTTPATNATTGQPDYSQQWVEYYRSIGQNDVADQIMQQMKEPGSTSTPTSNTNTTNSAAAEATAAAQAAAMMMSAANNPWAAYTQWANSANGVGSAAAAATATNGNSSSAAPSA